MTRMSKKVFFKRFKGYNGPEHRGAPFPPFDPAALNPALFADELRLKYYSIKYDETKPRVTIYWDSQSWSEDTDSLKSEIRRCFHHIGFRGNVILNLARRGERGIPDGYHEYIRFVVGERIPGEKRA